MNQLVDRLEQAQHYIDFAPSWQLAEALLRKGQLDAIITSTLAPPPASLTSGVAPRHASWLFLLETGTTTFSSIDCKPFQVVPWPCETSHVLEALSRAGARLKR